MQVNSPVAEHTLIPLALHYQEGEKLTPHQPQGLLLRECRLFRIHTSLDNAPAGSAMPALTTSGARTRLTKALQEPGAVGRRY